MSKRAILYARVSTDEQAKEDKTSIQTQIDECRKYAERIGYPVVAEFRDDYTGMVTLAERPQGKKLAEMLQRREAEAVIARRVNRLSRDVVDLMVTARQWLRAGLEIHIAQHGRKVDREDDIVFMLEGWQGTTERRDIVERATEGLYNKARAGRVVGTGNAPYGYRYGNGCPIIVEEEAKIVQWIYVWYTQGNERGERLALWGIARRLSELRIPTPAESGRASKRMRGACIWNTLTIRGILKSEPYCGIWRYGKTKSTGKQGNQTQPRQGTEQQVAVAVRAIVDRAMSEQAQVQRKRNSQMAIRNCRREYLLRGMIRCRYGNAMVGDTSRGEYSYYVCGTLPALFGY
jgi:site-specific DNA recombinase